MRILVTGANGFVGSALCEEFSRRGYQVHGAVRAVDELALASAPLVSIGDIGADTDWGAAVRDIDTVVHIAARVHVDSGESDQALADFRRVNCAATKALAKQAAQAGVRRLVFISSAKVNGDATANAPFTEIDPPRPLDAYAISKFEAERALAEVASQTGLEVVIVRPPLVYGPGVKANFRNLLRAVDRGFPLPLRGIDNRRSLIYLGNLIDVVARCVEHPDAAGKTYLVSDGEDVSTPELIRRLASAMNRPALLFSLPQPLMKLAAMASGRGDAITRLTESLQLDSSRIRNELNWTPPYTMRQGLHETVRWYRQAAT